LNEDEMFKLAPPLEWRKSCVDRDHTQKTQELGVEHDERTAASVMVRSEKILPHSPKGWLAVIE
jgi:hypothetical protein